MASNYPGPYEIDLGILTTFNSVPLEHRLRFNCAAVGSPAPGTAFSAINVQTRGGSTVTADTAIGTLWGWLRPFYHTTTIVTDVQMWQYATGTFAKTFVSALGSSLPAGSSAVATNPAQQLTLSFRSANSGIMKITLLENNSTGRVRAALVANAAGNDIQKLAAYVISSAGWMIARDDGFPIAPTFFTEGQNEAVFKQRFR